MQTTTDDWPTAVRLFEETYGDRRTNGRRFSGVNFMTPELLGFVRTDDGPVEVSTGVGLLGERIYGLTWPRRGSELDERDRCCFSWDEVVSALP